MKFKGFEFDLIQDETDETWKAEFTVDPLTVSVHDVGGPGFAGHPKEHVARHVACECILKAVEAHFKGPETFRDYQKKVLAEMETQLDGQVTRLWMKRCVGRAPSDKASKHKLQADFAANVTVPDAVTRILAENPVPSIEDQ